ncbi:hypothetical protein RHMOL_Rhmol05G0256200 [Rhododendron molle]|uniref:Uncharacterized protein n=1 Tax=Rhododendron molle TaxID=49168 RepID=A0ACC0NT90_RHOML|nr:hypothetical protein RHMOL_Rhmol05G0256200 [Rhododendron molle]
MELSPAKRHPLGWRLIAGGSRATLLHLSVKATPKNTEPEGVVEEVARRRWR